MACIKVHIGVDQYSTIRKVETLLTELGLSFEVSTQGQSRLPKLSCLDSIAVSSVASGVEAKHPLASGLDLLASAALEPSPQSMVDPPVLRRSHGFVGKARAIASECLSLCVDDPANEGSSSMETEVGCNSPS